MVSSEARWVRWVTVAVSVLLGISLWEFGLARPVLDWLRPRRRDRFAAGASSGARPRDSRGAVGLHHAGQCYAAGSADPVHTLDRRSRFSGQSAGRLSLLLLHDPLQHRGGSAKHQA